MSESNQSVGMMAYVGVDPVALLEDHPMLAYSMATMAAAQNQSAELKKFLDAGLDPANTAFKIKQRGSSKEVFLCPFIAATVNGSIESLEECLSHSTRSKLSGMKPQSMTALVRAVDAGQEASALWLIEKMPKIVKTSHSGVLGRADGCAVTAAAARGMDSAVTAALANGSFKDAAGSNPSNALAQLAAASAFGGCPNALARLLEEGVRLNSATTIWAGCPGVGAQMSRLMATATRDDFWNGIGEEFFDPNDKRTIRTPKWRVSDYAAVSLNDRCHEICAKADPEFKERAEKIGGFLGRSRSRLSSYDSGMADLLMALAAWNEGIALDEAMAPVARPASEARPRSFSL